MRDESTEKTKPSPTDELIDEVLRRLDKLWLDVSMIEDVFSDHAFPEKVMFRGQYLYLDDMLKIFKGMREQTRTLQQYGCCN